ncbi:MAG: transcriptional repressor [Planctomycetaceae bacterium]|jgi:Fur family transcriptional regulator, ferric uptake regulator|nr:transcriptional repressor [Planctomycetaceae bacterium]MBT6154585.1 transcriptional repressor [Planctomycetaceae bacterium]MBT6487195.1 transcriptional repressor [Planctomycetaceae bacterium]
MKSKQRSDEVAELRALIRDAGLRCTASRLAVMGQLRRATSPISHAELACDLAPLGFDKATVFRNLVDLTDANLLSRTELGDHVWRFELKSPGDPHDGGHPHFVCVDCGGVTCLGDVEFNTASKRRAGRIGRVTEILLKGYCRSCR